MWREVRAALTPNLEVQRRTATIIAVLWAVALLMMWSLSPYVVIPHPTEVLQAFGRLWMTQGLRVELWTSFVLALQCVAIAFPMSFALACASRIAFLRPLAGIVGTLRFVGLVGVTIVFTVLIGGGHWLKVALIVFGMVGFMTKSLTRDLAEDPDLDEQLDYARTLRMNEWHAVFEIVVIGRRHVALGILQETIAIAWVMLTMVETIVRSGGGIGTLLASQNKAGQYDALIAIQISVYALGAFLSYLIGVGTRLMCPYLATSNGGK